MRSIKVISFVGFVVTMVATASVLSSDARGLSIPVVGPFALPFVSPATDSSLASEIAVLVRDGVSHGRAEQTIDVQHLLGQTNLGGRLETTLGTAYAGVWFDPEHAQLHVGVTSPESRILAATVAAKTGLTAHVIETPVRSTWAQLLAAQARLNHRLKDLLAHEDAETAIAPERNAVRVTLSLSVPSRRRAIIEREASVSAVKTLIAIVPHRRLSATTAGGPTACKLFKEGEAYCDEPLTSGVTIKSTIIKSERSVCTAGPMLIPKVTKLETYLLTAGHCVLNFGGVGRPWYAFDREGLEGEIGWAKTASYNINGDFATIQVNEPGAWSLPGDDPVFALTAEWNATEPLISYAVKGEKQPLIHTLSCHEGQTTGQSCGEIKAINVTRTLNGVVVGGLDEVEGPELEVNVGDSGGPELTFEENGEALIEGIAVGREEGKKKLYFEPLETILKELKPQLNAELLTKSNEVRTEAISLANWLAAGTDLETGLSAETTGAVLFEDKSTAAGKVAVLCSDIMAGTVGPEGEAVEEKLLNLAKEEILLGGLALLGSGTGSDCVSVSTCAEGTSASPIEVWAEALPWSGRVYTMENGEILEVVEGTAYKFLCLILGLNVEDLCEAASSELRVMNDPGSGDAEIPTGSVAMPLANCSLGGTGSGVYETDTLSTITLTDGELLTVSAE